MVGDRIRRMFGDPCPQALFRLLFGKKTLGLDEPVRITSVAVLERDRMHQSVAVERVIPLDWFEQGRLGVAQIDTIQIGRDLADDISVAGFVKGVVFIDLGSPHAGAVGMVVVRRQGMINRCEMFDLHGVSRVARW